MTELSALARSFVEAHDAKELDRALCHEEAGLAVDYVAGLGATADLAHGVDAMAHALELGAEIR